MRQGINSSTRDISTTSTKSFVDRELLWTTLQTEIGDDDGDDTKDRDTNEYDGDDDDDDNIKIALHEELSTIDRCYNRIHRHMIKESITNHQDLSMVHHLTCQHVYCFHHFYCHEKISNGTLQMIAQKH